MRRAIVAALCATIVVALAACGGDNTTSTTAGAAAPATTAAAAAPAASGDLDQASIDLGVAYAGGAAGKADAAQTPVTIGFMVQTGATPSFPEQEAAADSAVSFINDYAGGIGGHPLKLDKCVVQSEEDGQKCGAQMLKSKVPIANWSLAVVGNSSFHATIKTAFPTIVSVTAGAADNSSDDTYALDGGSSAVLYGMAGEAQKEGIKSVAMVSSGNAAGKFSTGKLLTPQLEDLGIKIKTVYIADTATTPDVVSALQAAGASSADAVMLNPSAPGECVSLYDGLKQLGIKKSVITTPICNADLFVDHAAPGPTGWTISNFNVNPRITDNPQVKLFRGALKHYDNEKYTTQGFAPKTFGDILTIAKFANAIGPDSLTPAAFKEQVLAFRGPMFMVPGEIRCGKNLSADLKSNCGDSAAVAAFVDNAWKDLGAIKNESAKFGT